MVGSMSIAYSPVTICAIATAPGRGGVGVIRVSGRDLLPLAVTLTGGKTPKPRYAMHTDFLAADGTPIDNGLLLYFPGPHSFTGEDVLELQGHAIPLRLLIIRFALATKKQAQARWHWQRQRHRHIFQLPKSKI